MKREKELRVNILRFEKNDLRKNQHLTLKESAAAMMPFLPHAIVQLETGFICDLELIVGRIPRASRLIVQGKKIVA